MSRLAKISLIVSILFATYAHSLERRITLFEKFVYFTFDIGKSCYDVGPYYNRLLRYDIVYDNKSSVGICFSQWGGVTTDEIPGFPCSTWGGLFTLIGTRKHSLCTVEAELAFLGAGYFGLGVSFPKIYKLKPFYVKLNPKIELLCIIPSLDCEEGSFSILLGVECGFPMWKVSKSTQRKWFIYSAGVFTVLVLGSLLFFYVSWFS